MSVSLHIGCLPDRSRQAVSGGRAIGAIGQGLDQAVQVIRDCYQPFGYSYDIKSYN